MVWIARVQMLSDEASRVSSIANNALIWEGNYVMTRTIETGMKIMSQSPVKMDGPHDPCQAGCNATQIAGSTQIRPWLMQREAISLDGSCCWFSSQCDGCRSNRLGLGTGSARD